MGSEDGQTQAASVQYLQTVLFAKERDLRVSDPSQSELKQSSVTDLLGYGSFTPPPIPSLVIPGVSGHPHHMSKCVHA